MRSLSPLNKIIHLEVKTKIMIYLELNRGKFEEVMRHFFSYKAFSYEAIDQIFEFYDTNDEPFNFDYAVIAECWTEYETWAAALVDNCSEDDLRDNAEELLEEGEIDEEKAKEALEELDVTVYDIGATVLVYNPNW